MLRRLSPASMRRQWHSDRGTWRWWSAPLACALLLAWGSLLRADAGSGPGPLNSDRGRVAVARNAHGYLTVLTDQRTPLRGGAAFVYKSGRRVEKTTYLADPVYYRRMRDGRLNAVRLIAFDAFQKTRGKRHTDFNDPKDVADLLTDVDNVVNLASAAGMYVVINYHDVGAYEAEYLEKFWDLIAPRYRDRPHVLYELMNEPVKWFPEHYNDQHLTDIQKLYARVRGAAPHTHLILLTFANTASYDKNVSMRTVVERLSNTGTGIDWRTASVGFHTYQTKKTSRPITDLAKHFPAINTEQNLPNNEGSIPMDGEEYGVQTMERLGLSWFHWLTHGPERLEKNYERRTLLDAKAKGYLWSPDGSPEKQGRQKR